LDTKEGGMGMMNIENLIRSKKIKIIYKIIHSDLECWNYIGIYWLKNMIMALAQIIFDVSVRIFLV
jgi:hypothetical protein